jgi:tetratricopeptide (TPR) repeat protein
MKKAASLLFILIVSASMYARSAEVDPLKTYHEANMAYQKLDFEKSIRLYEELIQNRNTSASIYYNLGNAYFKSGNFAKAILNYERALKLTPDDEEVNFNLKIASLKVVDKMETVPEIFYKKWINKFATLLSSKSWTILFITTVWLLFAAASFYFIGRSVRIKKISFVFMIVLIFLSGSTGIIAARSHAITYVDKKGIIMSSSVYVKSSPDEKGNDLFILHEGTKVEILDNLNNWNKIRIANGGIGWMQSADLTTI